MDKDINGKIVKIKMGADNYVNRLVAFCESQQKSERFNDLVGSNLSLLGDRLDAAFRAAQKGSHASVTRDEASRTVVFTYLLIGDILELKSEISAASPADDPIADAIVGEVAKPID